MTSAPSPKKRMIKREESNDDMGWRRARGEQEVPGEKSQTGLWTEALRENDKPF